MDISKHYINSEKAYLIDKSIITKNSEFNFRLYGHNSKEDDIALISEKENNITSCMVKDLISTRFLYVYEKEKSAYDRYYSKFIENSKKNASFGNYLDDASILTHKLFENPESLSHVKDIKNTVENTVSIILKDDSILSSALSIFSHDYYTHTHSIHVKVYALCLGKHMGMSKAKLEALGTSALLHDLGKSKIPKEIINKNGKLTNSEFKKMMNHPSYGYEIARKLNITNKNVLSGIRNHHEKMDGTGYPDGLKKTEISEFARIIAICDVFDALTSKRSYKDPFTSFNALSKMKTEMNNHLDMSILDKFIKMFQLENKK